MIKFFLPAGKRNVQCEYMPQMLSNEQQGRSFQDGEKWSLARDMEVLCLKHGSFEERLDGILTRAALRLQERMRLAYFRGELIDYLGKLGLKEEIDGEILARESLLELQDEAVLVLARKIRYARKQGYLKDYLRQVNMLEILYLEQQKKAAVKPALRPLPTHHMVAKENRDPAQVAQDRELRLQRFRVIK